MKGNVMGGMGANGEGGCSEERRGKKHGGRLRMARTLGRGRRARCCTRRVAKKFSNYDEEQELGKLMLKTMKVVVEIATEAMGYANYEDGSVIGEIELLLLPEYGERKQAKI